MKFRFQKIRNVESPVRTHDYDAGLDFFIPNDIGWESFTVRPGTQKLLPSGIKADIPEGFALVCFEKSSIASKGLIIGARIVDAEYQGEIHIHLINPTKEDITVKSGQKICQFVLVPVIATEPVEIPIDQQLFNEKTSRGEGGFGSTGTGLKRSSYEWENPGVSVESKKSKGKFTGKKTVKGETGSHDFSDVGKKSKAADEEME